MTTRPATVPDPEDLPLIKAVGPAVMVAASVRAGNRDAATDQLADMTREDLETVALALACMTPDKAGFEQILGRCAVSTQRVYRTDATLWSQDEVREAHAAFARQVREPWVIRGEREYQRRRKLRQRELERANRAALEVRAAAS
ncbi:hypothetical protein [Serinicoccus sediminis]|uniref:hypothetical protein n=1 Tax=Serinicoccus sediminis TaxID=2306021 RepID=UPI00102070FB|nr:hypothetical protein [Serinicoccus sediminis]